MVKRGLGMGLDVLFNDATAVSEPDASKREPVKVKITLIEPNSRQPRKRFDREPIDELCRSIKEHGIIQPLAVRPNGDRYEIIAGERRWRAARQAGLDEIPVIILDVDRKTAFEMALVENLQREDLNPVEEALGYKALMEEFKLTQEQAAEKVSKSRPAVANALRILTLPPEIIGMVEKGELSAGHAKAVLQVKDNKLALELAKRAVERKLSVRQTEELASKLSAGDKNKAFEIKVNYAQELEKKIEKALKRKVKIIHSAKKGKIVLEYYGLDDLDNLTKALINLKG